VREREGLIARIRHIRSSAAAAEQRSAAALAGPRVGAPPLEARVAHLEHLVEGLQDSVHRESERHARMIAELQEQVDPATMNAALTKDARDRGL